MNNGPSEPNPESRFPQPLAESLPVDDDLTARRPAQQERPTPSFAPPADPAQRAAVDAALRQANLARVRGNFEQAERDARRALDADPTAGAAHEVLGDILLQRDETKSALASYRRAQSCGAGASVEGKIARLLLKSQPDTSMSNAPLMRGQGPLGMVASALIPGLGVALAGETTSAAVCFFGWILSLALLFAIPGCRSVIAGFAGQGGPSPGGGAEVLTLVLAIVNIGFWVYSLMETARVNRPTDKDGSQD
jgi:hypothetical protein